MKNNFMKKICFSLVLLLVLFFSISVNAATFNISFDNTPDDELLVDPIVGQGYFQFDGSVSNGTYSLTTLTNYDFYFNFGGTVFTTGEIYTPVERILVIFSDSESGQQVNFKRNFNEWPTPPFLGSIDFLDSTTDYVLSLDDGDQNGSIPSNYFIAASKDINSSKLFEGSYGPTPVPLPAAIWLLGSGVIGLAMMRRKSEK